MPSARSSTLTSTFNTCMLTQTNSNDVSEFAPLFASHSLSSSICLPISASLSCIQICLPLLLLVRLCIFTQFPLFPFYFISDFFSNIFLNRPSVSFSLTHTDCIKACQEAAKPLTRCVSYLQQSTSWEGKILKIQLNLYFRKKKEIKKNPHTFSSQEFSKINQ